MFFCRVADMEGKYFFNIVKEGDQVFLASDDDNERTLWVQAIYRATGQSHKPVLATMQPNRLSNTQLSRLQGGLSELLHSCYLQFSM